MNDVELTDEQPDHISVTVPNKPVTDDFIIDEFVTEHQSVIQALSGNSSVIEQPVTRVLPDDSSVIEQQPVSRVLPDDSSLTNNSPKYYGVRKKDGLLTGIVICFCISVAFVFLKYECNDSISSIICDTNNVFMVLLSTLFMGIFIVLYELERGDTVSFNFIGVFLICMYCVICTNEKMAIHYVFAGSLFFTIIGFMAHHSFSVNTYTLLSMLYLQIILTALLMWNVRNQNIFFNELVLIINFALYYLYLHGINS